MRANPRAGAICLMGPPGPATIWFQAALRGLLGAAEADLQEFLLDDDKATTEFLAKVSDAATLLIVSHFPRQELFDFLASEDIVTLVVVEKPIISVNYHVSAEILPFYDAARTLTQSLSLVRGAQTLKLKVGIYSETLDLPAARIIEFLNKILGEVCGPDLIECDAAIEFAKSLDTDSSLTKAAWKSSLSHVRDFQPLSVEEERLVTQVCGGILKLIRGEAEGVSVSWPVSFFFDGGTLTSPARPVIDVTGPARCIFYGPYLHLPIGQWEGQVTLGFSEDISDNYLRVEVFTDAPQIEYISKVNQPGVFEMPIAFEVKDPRKPLQLRVFMDRGEISGKIGLPYVTLRPVNEAA
jgi:hypothetical protein